MDLSAQPRTVLGKKVKALRRQGITPVHVYGPGVPSESLQADTVELQHVLAAAGSSTLFKLNAGDGRGKASYDVMLREVQRDRVTGQVLHVDLYRVQMSQPVAVDVPLVVTGLSPAVDNHLGTLVHGANSLHIQGLPGELPTSIEVDVSVLVEAHQAIHARDLTMPPGITLLSDRDQVIVNVVPPRGAEIAEAEAEAAAAEAEAAAAAAAEAEGEAPAAEEGEEKPEGEER